MSGEFGDHTSGYFHQKVASAADDCTGSDHATTIAIGVFLAALTEPARAVAYHEAGDSGADYPVRAFWEAMIPALRSALWGFETITRAVDRAMVDAVAAVLSLPAPSWCADRHRDTHDPDAIVLTCAWSPPPSAPSWSSRVYHAALLRHVELWAHKQRRAGRTTKAFSWKLASHGGRAGEAAEYLFLPSTYDEHARAALEEVRAVLDGPGNDAGRVVAARAVLARLSSMVAKP